MLTFLENWWPQEPRSHFAQAEGLRLIIASNAHPALSRYEKRESHGDSNVP